METSNGKHCLTKNGQPLADIVLAHGASTAEEFAAAELAAYLHTMSGARVPVRHGVRNRERASIVILDAGRPSNRVFLDGVPVDELRHDGYLIQSVGSDLFITSKDLFGVVHGTYQYLRRVLGCTFHDYPPQGEDVPRRRTVTHGVVALLKNPKLAYRNMQMAYSLRRIDWMAKNGFNWIRYGNDQDLDWWDAKLNELAPHLCKRGMQVSFGHHSFHMILPPRLYEDDHPDYFAKNETPAGYYENCPAMGDPEKPRAQFPWDMTHPDVLDEASWRIEKFLGRHPEIGQFDFWPSDGRGHIRPDEYKAMTGEEMPGEGEWTKNAKFYSLSGRLGDPRKTKVFHLMAKRVGEALQPKLPNVEFVISAYSDMTQPVPDVRLPENVSTTVAMYWRCYRHDTFDENCRYNQQFNQILAEWRDMYPDRPLYLSEYYMGMTGNASLPYPIVTTLFREWPRLVERGIAGAKVNTGRDCDTAAVPYNINYLAFQAIVWDDAEDREVFLEDYCKGFFGEGWEEMRDLHLVWEDRLQQGGCTQPGVLNFPVYFDEETVKRSRPLVHAAMEKAEGAARYRIERIDRLLAYTAQALPVGRLEREREDRLAVGKDTADIDRKLAPLLEKLIAHVNELKALDLDIIGEARPTKLFGEGDMKSKPFPLERLLARIRKEVWIEKDFDPDLGLAAARKG